MFLLNSLQWYVLSRAHHMILEDYLFFKYVYSNLKMKLNESKTSKSMCIKR